MNRKVADAYPLLGQPFRSRLTPGRTLGELMTRPWMEGAVPIALSILLAVVVVFTTPEILQGGDIRIMLSRFAEIGLIAVALTIVLLGGGFDLSVGGMVGLTALGTMVLFRVYELPSGLVIVLGVVGGALLGSINGAFIAFVRTRPLITTLVTALGFRALMPVVQETYASQLVFPRSDAVWTFIGGGTLFGLPVSVWIILVVLAATHLFLTRSRWGWWLAATGSDRRSARRNGIPIVAVTFLSYVVSGALCGMAGFLISARQGNTSATIGAGYEIVALTAVVLGGVSLRGGRGSVIRAAIGTIVVAILSQAVFRQGLSEGWNTLILAAVLITFAILDDKWGKHRLTLASKISMSPFAFRPKVKYDHSDQTSIWKQNAALSDAQPMGLGVIEGAEDLVVDDQGRVYCGDRRGWIWRLSGENFEQAEIFARTGGTPLGHVIEPSGALVVAVGGIGLARIGDDRKVDWIATRTKRTPFRLHDDSVLRFADDLDVAADGSIYFSEASTHLVAREAYGLFTEGRPDGRVLRLAPDGTVETVARNFLVANGICTAHDGVSILIASSLAFRVDRLWIDGPKKGTLEPVMTDLPGLPDNINRASDGNYWLAFDGMRTPLSDLLAHHPRFRRRMSKRLPPDEWVVAQQNMSCVIKFDDAGRILKVLWDETQSSHPSVTSMSERGGYLYLGGLHSNRVGRIRLKPEDIGPIDPYAIPGTAAAAARTEVRA
jgi:ribose transport system permease protein